MASLWKDDTFRLGNLSSLAGNDSKNSGESAKLQGLDLLTFGVKPSSNPIKPPTNPIKPPSTRTKLFTREAMFGESGWAMPALKGVGGAAMLGLGILDYREAKKTRKEQTRQFNKNFEMQSNVLEARIRDRYDARHRMGGSNTYNSADDAVKAVMKR